ncbi:PAS domain-containing protein [Fulvimarina sp. 2208YS6-2-32]|uniref:PAS domain-containing protein n=1 Tax=Fulvimarina uroteuthidis TaxID=3098149 RepID=A0ABU5I3G2_9HYPH|nr:PAS domain-containing protein [Fulvimarina sp. 2208YS6-2-32]MDY8109630.1 PAS domain-containing protein [Fulvimarina sp. 2208YS6-2-32]
MEQGIEPALTAFARTARVAVTISDAAADDLPLFLVNDRFCQLSGYSADEVIGKNCRFLQGEARDQPGTAHIREFLRNPAPRSLRTTLLNFRKDGTPFVNLILMTKLTDQRHRPRYIFASQFDVTRTSSDEMARQDKTLKGSVATMSAIASDHRYIMNASFETLGKTIAQIAQCRLALAETG